MASGAWEHLCGHMPDHHWPRCIATFLIPSVGDCPKVFAVKHLHAGKRHVSPHWRSQSISGINREFLVFPMIYNGRVAFGDKSLRLEPISYVKLGIRIFQEYTACKNPASPICLGGTN
jgi:hypothetical protein